MFLETPIINFLFGFLILAIGNLICFGSVYLIYKIIKKGISYVKQKILQF